MPSIPANTLREILRLHELGSGVNAIARNLGVAKSTVSKYLKRQEHIRPPVEYPSTLNPEVLLEKLVTEKSQPRDQLWEELFLSNSKRKKSERFTIKELHEQYAKTVPNPMSYSTFWRGYNDYIERLPKGYKELAMTLSWKPGEVAMIDYAGDRVFIQSGHGTQTTANVFVGILANSGYTFCYATPRQTRDDWLDGIIEMLAYFGGVPDYIYLDNSTSLVNKADRFCPEVSPEFVTFCEHYGTIPFPVSPYEPTHKGLVENAVNLVQTRILKPLRSRQFFSIDELNEEMFKLLEKHNASLFSDKSGDTRNSRFLEEKRFLKPLPSTQYELSTKVLMRKVNKNLAVRIENRRFTVPYQYAGQTIRIVQFPRQRRVEMFNREGTRIAEYSYPIQTTKRIENHIQLEHLPPNQQSVVMLPRERYEALAAIGPFTKAYAKTFLKMPSHVANKRLTGLQNYARRLTPEAMEACCQQVLESYDQGFRRFTEVVSHYEGGSRQTRTKLTQKFVKIDVSHSTNLRGDDYYRNKEKERERKE